MIKFISWWHIVSFRATFLLFKIVSFPPKKPRINGHVIRTIYFFAFFRKGFPPFQEGTVHERKTNFPFKYSIALTLFCTNVRRTIRQVLEAKISHTYVPWFFSLFLTIFCYFFVHDFHSVILSLLCWIIRADFYINL